MTSTTFKTLIAMSALVSAFAIHTPETEAAINHSDPMLESSEEIATTAETQPMQLARNSTTAKRKRVSIGKKRKPRSQFVGTIKRRKFNVTTNAPRNSDADDGWHSDWMGDICTTAGGGASSNPDGTVSCVDADGNDVLDPVPAPD